MANRKFVRALTLNTPTNFSTPYILGLLYNLWGYVLYGSASPTAPAAAAFPTTNPNNFPAGSLEGGTVLLASGTNGSTTNGTNVFTSAGASFTTAMIGSVLVMWIPGSGITDDGIYLITGVPSATQLQIQVANGGHPDPTTLQPVLTTRSGINYRVVNISAMTSFSFVTTSYIIFQLNPPASDNPNPSQATSQVQCILNGNGGTQGINMIGSPAGTWSGSAFTDAMSGVSTNTNSGGFDSWNPTVFNMTADFDGVFIWFKGNGAFGGSSNIYFEAPTRVGTYPTTTSDQNPLVLSTDGLCSLFTSQTNGTGFNNFHMVGTDLVTRQHRMQVKNVTGDGNQSGANQYNTIISAQGIGDIRLAYAFDRGSTFVSQIMLGQLSTATNWTRCRAILKQAYSCAGVVPVLHRLGPNGQYLHIQNGVCQIWDNTIMPISLIPYGF